MQCGQHFTPQLLSFLVESIPRYEMTLNIVFILKTWLGIFHLKTWNRLKNLIQMEGCPFHI